MKAPDKNPSGFVVYVDGLAFSEDGKPLKAYVQLDRFGPVGPESSVGYPIDPSFATKFNLRAANAWVEAHPGLAARAHVVHSLTALEVAL